MKIYDIWQVIEIKLAAYNYYRPYYNNIGFIFYKNDSKVFIII